MSTRHTRWQYGVNRDLRVWYSFARLFIFLPRRLCKKPLFTRWDFIFHVVYAKVWSLKLEFEASLAFLSAGWAMEPLYPNYPWLWYTCSQKTVLFRLFHIILSIPAFILVSKWIWHLSKTHCDTQTIYPLGFYTAFLFWSVVQFFEDVTSRWTMDHLTDFLSFLPSLDILLIFEISLYYWLNLYGKL